MIKFNTYSPFGKITGCLSSLFKNDPFNWLQKNIIPLPFKNGSICLMVEILGIATSLPLIINALSSEFCWNYFFLKNLINWTSLSWSSALPCNGSLIASIFIFLRRICFNIKIEDINLFILFHVNIFSSSWWSMSKDTSV